MGGEPPFAAACTKVSYAQLVYFAKSRGQPKLDRHHRINMLRCSPSKQTLAHERSILACWMTASQDKKDLGLPVTKVRFRMAAWTAKSSNAGNREFASGAK
jgi:hypothetical protein